MIKHHEGQPYRVVTEMRNSRPRQYFAIGCCKCPETLRLHLKADFPPDAVAQKFRRRGWGYSEHSGRHHYCPSCLNAGKRPVQSKREVLTMNKQQSPGVSLPAPTVTVREASMPEIRLILALVADHFDDAKGCYLGGYDDDRVARELDLPRAMVTKVREESGLKLKWPSLELAAMAAEMTTMRSLLDDFEARFRALMTKAVR